MSTTRSGSETTTLTVGDPVRIGSLTTRSGRRSRFAGRRGWVAAVNRQTFPTGVTYIEIGVSFLPSAAGTKRMADAWFRADELVPA